VVNALALSTTPQVEPAERRADLQRRLQPPPCYDARACTNQARNGGRRPNLAPTSRLLRGLSGRWHWIPAHAGRLYHRYVAPRQSTETLLLQPTIRWNTICSLLLPILIQIVALHPSQAHIVRSAIPIEDVDSALSSEIGYS